MKPMLAAPFEGPITYPRIAEPKANGIRGMVRVENGRVVSAVSREGRDLPALAGAVVKLARSAGGPCWLDMELLADTGFAGTLSAARGQTQARLALHPLDLVRDGESKNLVDRLADVDAVVAACGDPRVIRLERRVVHNEAEAREAYAEYRAKGWEGAMLKSPRSLYEPGKRGDAWVKLKPALDMDCEIVDAYEGKGKHAGSLGGFVVRTPFGVLCRVFPGKDVSNADRARLWTIRGSLRGTTCEVSYQEVLASGQLRHGRFERVRTDRGAFAYRAA